MVKNSRSTLNTNDLSIFSYSYLKRSHSSHFTLRVTKNEWQLVCKVVEQALLVFHKTASYFIIKTVGVLTLL